MVLMTPINKRYLVISIVILSIGLIFLMHIQFDIFSHKRGNVQKKLEVTNSTIEDAAVKDNIIENIQEKSHVNNNKVIRDVPKEEKPHADNNEVMKDVPQEENKTTLSAKEEDEMNNLFDDLLEELEIFDFKEIDIVPMLLSPNDCNLPSLDENSVSLDLNTLELFFFFQAEDGIRDHA